MKNKVCWSRKQELLPPWNCRLRKYHDLSGSSGREAGAKPARLRDAVSPSRRRLPGLCSALSPEGSALARQPRGFAPSHPAKRPAALGDLRVTAAARTPHLQRGDKLPPSRSPRRQLAAGFPTGPLAALAGRAFSAPLQPPVTSAQRSSRILSNKAGARSRPGKGLRLAAEASEPWQAPTPRRAQQERAAGAGEERGEESVLLRARNPPGLIHLPQLPLTERILPSLWDWAGRRAKRCGLCGLTDQSLPYLCPE